MKKIQYILLIVLAIGSVSCKKDQYYLYNDVARIQFGPNPSRIYIASANLADTVKPFTFYYEAASVKEDTVFFDIYAIGGISEKDRTFALEQEQLSGENNAVAGTHYVGFNDPKATKSFVIKAGTVHTSVPIILLRDASLKTNTVILKLKVVANQDFQLGEVNNLWRKITFTDRLSQPAAWDANVSRVTLGDYSLVKHQFMIESTGQKWDQNFSREVLTDFALRQYWAGTLKINLINYNNAHPGNPLRDEDGELVIFP